MNYIIHLALTFLNKWFESFHFKNWIEFVSSSVDIKLINMNIYIDILKSFSKNIGKMRFCNGIFLNVK